MNGNLHEWVHDYFGDFPPGTWIDWRGRPDHPHRSHSARGGAFDCNEIDCATWNFRPGGGWLGYPEFAIHHFGFRVLRELPKLE